MDAFDGLPRWLRDIVNDYGLNPERAAYMLQCGFTEDEFIETLDENDIKRVKKHFKAIRQAFGGNVFYSPSELHALYRAAVGRL